MTCGCIKSYAISARKHVLVSDMLGDRDGIIVYVLWFYMHLRPVCTSQFYDP